jgi:hypothetical protein
MATIVRRQLFITPHHSFSRPPLHVFRLHYSFSAPQGSFLAPPPPAFSLRYQISASTGSTGRLLPSTGCFLLPPAVFCLHRPFSASIAHFLPLLPNFCLSLQFSSLPTPRFLVPPPLPFFQSSYHLF